MHNKPIVLIILDGFGIDVYNSGNAIAQASIPNLTAWMQSMPYAILKASGNSVGLPEQYVGNSEVGHITLGAGRIIEQPITKINNAIQDGSFFKNAILQANLQKCAQQKKNLHIIGILSDAGVHGNQDHITAYLQAAHEHNIENIYVHAILDGRDTAPHTAYNRVLELEKQIKPFHAHIASIQGRFYAMDRNKNYERTQQAYRILTQPDEIITTHIKSHIVDANPSEEYCEPIRVHKDGIITQGDYVIFTACRADRTQQIVRALSNDISVIGKIPSVTDLKLISPVPYGIHVPTNHIFEQNIVKNTLKEMLCLHNRTIFSIAETEKYAHITYFFNGGKEDVLSCEVRHLIPSKRVKNYIHNPEMSAEEITNTIIRSLHKDPKDFYLINYANADMVGHSGDLHATIKAVEFLDHELGRLYKTLVQEMDGTLFIVGDHGNAEQKINPKTDKPSPTHTQNPVPFIIVTQQPLAHSVVANMHGLADVAPFILKYMGIPIPPEMTGTIE